MTKLSIQVQGIDVKDTILTQSVKDSYYLHEAIDINKVKIIEVNPIERNASEQSISIEYDKGDNTNITIIEFEDGTEWIGATMDIPEIFGNEYRSRGGGDQNQFIMPLSLDDGGQRGGGGKIIKFVKQLFFNKVKAKAAEATIKLIAEKVDKRIMPKEGLYFLKEGFHLKSANIATIDGQGKTYLLLLHGFLNRTTGSFSGLKEDTSSNVMASFRQKYKDNILAFDHRTASKSPIQNAIDVLKSLPKGCKIDILSQSRGGLVADLLARVSSNGPAYFSQQDMDQLIEEDDADSAKLLEKLNKIAQERKIEIQKVVRVACPAAGTALLSKRLDHWVNAILIGLGAVTGIGSPVLTAIREFLLEIIAAKAIPDAMPGVNAQVPDSPFQKILNNSIEEARANNNLFVVQGDADTGFGFGRSLLVILSNLYYLEPNDLVVDTASMVKGVTRQNGANIYFTNNNVHHFNYYKNDDTKQAIRDAIIWETGNIPVGYKNDNESIASRGVVLSGITAGIDFIASHREEKIQDVEGNKPIVLFLPGIMGSHLKVDRDKIWFNIDQIMEGRFCTDLDLNDPKEVYTDSITARYYTQFIRKLEKKTNYEVQIFPYDWRKSLTDSSNLLREMIEDLMEHQQPIKIIAHSMGGMVVKDLMMHHSDFWEEYINRDESRFIMLGSPWQGAYKVMSLLVGDESGLRQLIRFDGHKRERVIEVVHSFDGLFQLLPLDDGGFDKKSFWSNLNKGIRQKKFQFGDPYQDKAFFDKIKKYRTKARKFEISDFKNIYYVAGQDREGTIGGYYKENNYAESALHFVRTLEGDGTVTWKLGIPKDIPDQNLYYTQTIHGELANDKSMFEGLIDLLDKGTTNQLSKTAPATFIADRSGRAIGMRPQKNYHNGDLLDGFMGTGRIPSRTQTTDFVDELNVFITHAHLKVAAYPVMVGHFKKDGILSAEKALSRALDGKLEERQLLTSYPGDLKDNLIIYNKKSKPQGAIVIGLGDPSSLTAYNLMQTVEAGVLNYALYGRCG